ncbi:hypothetical protein GQ457_10G011770 [Hibiscus cannabinus]
MIGQVSTYNPAGGAIVPPIPQNNQQQPVKTVRDYLAEDLEGLNLAVMIPEFEAEHFELKSVMFNMLNTLGQFGESAAENARQHLKDKAKAWMNNLQPGSLQSWTELCRSFLARFSYNNMNGNLRNQITPFRQEDDEIMHEAWERYRDLFRRCSMHGLPEWTQVSIIYNSVNPPKRMMHDASANGTLLEKPPREGLEIMVKLTQNDYQHPTSRRGNMRRGTAQLDSSDTILAQIYLNKYGQEYAEASKHSRNQDEDHIDPTNTEEAGPTTEASQPEPIRPDKLEDIRPPPPFPQRLKKQKHDYQFKKFFDILKQVHIILPLVEALQKMPNYAKFLKDMVSRKGRIGVFETAAATETCLALMHNKVPFKKIDPGSFTIECSIGHKYSTKALCDPGASINLMPKYVFQKLGIGEAKLTTVMLQLANHSFVQPEGKIEDILV